MKIAVCLKLVPATTADIRVAPGGTALLLADVEMGVSLYDDYAFEAALRLREQFADSTLHALSVGGGECGKCLQHALALRADTALHIHAPGADARAAALLAAAALRPLAPDVVLCGQQALDDDLWLFPGALAELLDLPHVSAVATLEVAADRKSARCRARCEGGEQLVETTLPAVLSCGRGPQEPRVPTLKNRLAAKRKQPDVKTPAELSGVGVPACRESALSADSATNLEPRLRVTHYLPPAQRMSRKVLTNAPRDAAAELVRLLRHDAKVL